MGRAEAAEAGSRRRQCEIQLPHRALRSGHNPAFTWGHVCVTVAEVAAVGQRLQSAIGQVLVGKDGRVALLLCALLARRHVLLEDVPGTGKTTLVKALARSLGASYARLQFTPDLLPSDVTGFNAYDPRTGEFRFREGPVFRQLLLVDEINRASPKTQSALLECMEERQVSVDGVTYRLPDPFLVLATQNPVEYEGTFPLPEAQLDRFGLKLGLGYPSRDEEVALLDRFLGADPLETLGQVCTVAEVTAAQAVCRLIHVDAGVKQYAVDLCVATRRHAEVALGASPRASLALVALAQAHAALSGRDYVLPDDIKALAPWCLPHRVLLAPAARWREQTPDAVVGAVLRSVTVPAAVPRRG